MIFTIVIFNIYFKRKVKTHNDHVYIYVINKHKFLKQIIKLF
jgi:hypothetical protein